MLPKNPVNGNTFYYDNMRKEAYARRQMTQYQTERPKVKALIANVNKLGKKIEY